MNNILIKIWVHNMEVDLMVDFLLGMSAKSPDYVIDYREIPDSITGGWVELSIPFNIYLKLRQFKEHLNFLSKC
jgi:hypothetical protein